MNFKKLINSKWTAISPKNKEKHFIVTKVFVNIEDPQIVDSLVIEAIYSNRSFKLKPIDLLDTLVWKKGWL
jgi:tryptophan-rich hypothetical protein